jgi:hypothetical protein
MLFLSHVRPGGPCSLPVCLSSLVLPRAEPRASARDHLTFVVPCYGLCGMFHCMQSLCASAR